MGGKVSVESEYGKGTKFIMSIQVQVDDNIEAIETKSYIASTKNKSAVINNMPMVASLRTLVNSRNHDPNNIMTRTHEEIALKPLCNCKHDPSCQNSNGPMSAGLRDQPV